MMNGSRVHKLFLRMEEAIKESVVRGREQWVDAVDERVENGDGEWFNRMSTFYSLFSALLIICEVILVCTTFECLL